VESQPTLVAIGQREFEVILSLSSSTPRPTTPLYRLLSPFPPLCTCCYHVVWFLYFPEQLPRLYNVYKEMGIIQDFQTMLDNIFIPLFEVTADPTSHPQLHVFLQSVSNRTA
jgi:hypothetical protein